MLLLHRASSFLCLSHPKPQLIFSSAPRAPASARSDSVKILLPADRCRYGRLCSVGGDGNAYSPSDAESSCPSEEGIDHGGRHEGGPLASNETLKKLKRYGIAGILSYGLLNTAYYLTTFLLVWFYFAPAPGRMGYLAAVERNLQIHQGNGHGLGWKPSHKAYTSWRGPRSCAFCRQRIVLVYYKMQI
ncbi:hypothetical protein EUGRSUZ_G03186 [Eucalyptus grandis]|uniref:Uncharacterized protein n=2 Tax=Eucalyptus grandis TaxID=71139 RepID=A0A059BIY2_EUCGR|nr:hypothetical protein EUGRSUZ_G03186 [Eucalyptus grandis]